MLTGMSVSTATMQMPMRRNEHCYLMIDQRRMWRTGGMVGLTWKPLMLTGMSASMASSRMGLRSNNHRKPMMDQRTMWRI